MSLLGCVWYADGTERNGTERNGTGRDETGRDGTGRNEGVMFEKDMGYICLKMVKHCVPQTWKKPVPGGGGTQKHSKSVPWNSLFHPFLAHQTRDGTPRPVPSRPVPRQDCHRRDSVIGSQRKWRDETAGIYGNHPYAPRDLKLPGFVPGFLSQSTIVGVYGVSSLLVVSLTWLFSGTPLSTPLLIRS
ncbi:hypothetical protein DVH24_025208 [Malus domestica]|uniref:Uncharacterized protein n=1 Tax=Malus domestica TaxID=3750 RepID=A0A498HQJ5_MALDO|nr:hypothetical protein DVH24_025208 [Malus domestica]